MSSHFCDIYRVDADMIVRDIKGMKRRICELEDRLSKLEPEPTPDHPHDTMELEVLLKENYIRGYVTGKFHFIENIEKDTPRVGCKVRYRVHGYAYRKDIEFILRHASGVAKQPTLYRRMGESE